MKLVLKNCPNSETAAALTQTFKAAAVALDIANHAAEVHVDIVPGEVEYITDGVNRWVKSNLGGTEDKLRKGYIANVVLKAFNTPQMVQTFYHELAHVAQMLRGDLKTVRGVDIWKERRYRKPQNHEEYKNLPWEREAEAFATKMYKRMT